MYDLLAGKDLARLRATAESCRQVERAAAIPAVRRQRFTRVQPDADSLGKRRAAGLAAAEPGLEVDRGAKRATGRDEHA